MTRCADFWKKWRKEPNFCGLSPQAISEIKGYLELVDKIVKTGILEETVFEMCPSSTCRPVLRLADEETKLVGINYLCGCLKSGEKINSKNLQAKLDAFLKKGASCEAGSTRSRRVETPPLPVEKENKTGPGPAPVTPPEVNNEVNKPAACPPTLSAQMAGVVPPEPPVIHPAPCIGGSGCTHGKFTTDKVRGNVCNASGQPISQLANKECPLEAKKRKEAALGFSSGAQVKGGIAGEIYPDRNRNEPVQDRQLRITFDQKQWEILKQLQRAGQADGFEDAVKFCVDEIGAKMGGA